MKSFSILLLVLAACSAAMGQVLFKLGADGNNHYMDYINLRIIGGLVFYLLGTAIWIYVLSFEKLTNVYAFSALTFVFVYSGGVFILGESISLRAWFGVLMVICGLYLIGNNIAGE